MTPVRVSLTITHTPGDTQPGMWRRALHGEPLFKAWAAEITGTERSFLRGRMTVNADPDDHRAYMTYILEEERLYEISSLLAWNRCDRYFCTVDHDGSVRRLTREEASAFH